jgi:hypothetical protein
VAFIDEFKYYVYDAGVANDQLLPKVKLAYLAAFVPEHGASTKEREDGSFRYCHESFKGNDRSTEPGEALLGLLQADIRCRLLENGLVWRQHFQTHAENIELVLKTVLGLEKMLDGPLQDTKITKMPRTVAKVHPARSIPGVWCTT